jgi:glycosyltransferase involved in cell wall biosynthesis
MFRRNLQSATLLQAWSNWAKQSVITDYGIDAAKVVVNPPGIDLDLWKPSGPKPARSQDQPLKILFVGGDFRRKGGPLLMEWFKTLNHSRYELHLVTREPVESAPGVHVYHNMEPNSPELLRLYHTSDLFILPSLGECFGIATIEAMGAGLPVIATDVGGTADIIEPGRNGFIIPSKDVKVIGQAIEAILGDDTRRVEMGCQSRILAEERFDLEKNARRTFSYLEQLAAKQVVKRPVAV